MVWRDNIKVLGVKARALPLVVSMLLHMAVMVVFAFTNQEKEKIFHVELMMQDMGYMHQHQVKQSYRTSSRLSQPVIRDIDSSLSHEEKTEIKTDSVNTMETLPTVEGSNADTVSAKSTVSILTSGDKAVSEKSLLNAKAGGNSVAKIIGHGNAVVESEFGSANAPSFLKRVIPEYPRVARRLGREGRVVLMLHINKHGKLLNVEIIEKAGYGFDEAAMDAVKSSSFQPARVNDKPVDCKAILPISFKLQ